MSNIDRAMVHLNRKISERETNHSISFDEFLENLATRPLLVVRNAFQAFHDMVREYVSVERDEYPNDPESIKYVKYDCSRLFVNGTDRPFFADRLFANRFIQHVDAMRSSARQNKIYIFEGPPGSGKSTFLNNLLLKFEEYSNSDAGMRYEVIWKLDSRVLEQSQHNVSDLPGNHNGNRERGSELLEIPCPSHDNPLLLIPREDRHSFFDELFQNDEFKEKLFSSKEYEWLFRDIPCTICSSLFDSLVQRLPSSLDVYRMINARPYRFNRRLGEGVTIFNPGDKTLRMNVLGNDHLQNRLDALLGDASPVRYLHSSHAKTNNGVYALMDVKAYNAERLMELHNIISEGIHKVEDVEENVSSLFIALMNPEDAKSIVDFQSFTDRIEFIHMPYVMDLNTEVEIYRNTFGRHIDDSFLPRVLHNFARAIISTRMGTNSPALLEWIYEPERYGQYCDHNLQLLKMEIYTGHIPSWITEEDRKRLSAKRRRRIIDESEREGVTGFSGRDSLRIFGDFFTAYARSNKLISMSNLVTFFTKWRTDLNEALPEGLLDSLIRNYNYSVLQEVKESLYYFNEDQISHDLLNYMFAVNFEIGSVVVCRFTNDRLEITEDFLRSIEARLMGTTVEDDVRLAFRRETQKEYASRTLTQEILVEGKAPQQTGLFRSLHDSYVHNLKGKVMEPFLDNANFRRAIKDYDTVAFNMYDKRIRDDVSFLINNLCAPRFHYTKQGAREMCVYVIDNDLARRYPS